MVIIIVTIVLVIFIAVTIILRIFTGEFFFMAPSNSKMDRYLKANINELSCVADTLLELDYDSIVIRKAHLREEDKYNMDVSKDKFFNGSPNGSDRETIPIPYELIGSINKLHESGVRVITCSRNSVNFSVWAFMGDVRGIIYSKAGKIPDGGSIIKTRQLSKENWYYYIDNFEKWKARNPDLFQ